MPWEIRKVGDQYCVFKQDTDENEGCHETREMAEAHMAALYANEPEMMKAWSSSYITALPDSAFACVDSEGRHYPHHDASGKLDLPHLRNAMSRLGQEDTTSCGASHLRAHARAEGMGEKTADYLKAEQLTSTKWRVLGIPFGGPVNGKDTDEEFFSIRTDIKPHWFDRRPAIWHHNLDKTMDADSEIGTDDDLELDEKLGWWSTLWLNRQHQYFTAIDAMLRAGKIYGSSGSLPNFVKTDRKTGEILVWPYIEQTLTPTPANTFSVTRGAKAAAHFSALGIDLSPEQQTILTDLDSPTADLGLDLTASPETQSAVDPAIQRLEASPDVVRLKRLYVATFGDGRIEQLASR